MELRGLNEQQAQAVKATEGKVRIIAGAGSDMLSTGEYRAKNGRREDNLMKSSLESLLTMWAKH